MTKAPCGVSRCATAISFEICVGWLIQQHAPFLKLLHRRKNHLKRLYLRGQCKLKANHAKPHRKPCSPFFDKGHCGRRPRPVEGIAALHAGVRPRPSDSRRGEGRPRSHRALSTTPPRPSAHGREDAQGRWVRGDPADKGRTGHNESADHECLQRPRVCLGGDQGWCRGLCTKTCLSKRAARGRTGGALWRVSIPLSVRKQSENLKGKGKEVRDNETHYRAAYGSCTYGGNVGGHGSASLRYRPSPVKI